MELRIWAQNENENQTPLELRNIIVFMTYDFSFYNSTVALNQLISVRLLVRGTS